MFSVIDEIFQTVLGFIQQYGWWLVALAILVYACEDKIQDLKQWYALRRANDPERVRLLEEDRRRKRLQQRLESKTKKTGN
jgi:hypothetical protein